jgi:hypothetical protein
MWPLGRQHFETRGLSVCRCAPTPTLINFPPLSLVLLSSFFFLHSHRQQKAASKFWDGRTDGRVSALLSTSTKDAPIEIAVWSDILFFFRTFLCRKRERYREEGEGRGRNRESRERRKCWSRVCWEVVAKLKELLVCCCCCCFFFFFFFLFGCFRFC